MPEQPCFWRFRLANVSDLLSNNRVFKQQMTDIQ